MKASCVVVKIAAVGSVELVQSVDGVLGGVAVNDVQQHHDAQPVRAVDEFFQLFWRAVATVTLHAIVAQLLQAYCLWK